MSNQQTYRVGDVANGHQLGPDNVWRPVQPDPEQTYRVGDVANGHVLTRDNVWEPLSQWVTAPLRSVPGEGSCRHPTFPHPGVGPAEAATPCRRVGKTPHLTVADMSQVACIPESLRRSNNGNVQVHA